jgi:hypothetical protein
MMVGISLTSGIRRVSASQQIKQNVTIMDSNLVEKKSP